MGCCSSSPDENYNSGNQNAVSEVQRNEQVENKAGDWASDDAQMTVEENKIEGTIQYKVGDYRFVELQKWPVILLDTTGSMKLPCEANDPKTRKQLVYETIWQIAQYLIPYNDTEEDDEFLNNLSPQQALLHKGVSLLTFNAIEGGVDRNLLHPTNFVSEFSNIKFHGGTHIMDGWRKMLQSYENRFSDRPQDQWPLLLALIITDGELQDGQEFEQHVKNVKGRVFVEIAVIGFGEDHDKALAHYNKIAETHDHVRVTAFTDHTDPSILCKQLISLIDPKCIRQVDATRLIAPSLENYNNANNMMNVNPNMQPMPNQFVPNNMGYYNPNAPNSGPNQFMAPSTQVASNSNMNTPQFYNNPNVIAPVVMSNGNPNNNPSGPTAPYNPNY